MFVNSLVINKYKKWLYFMIHTAAIIYKKRCFYLFSISFAILKYNHLHPKRKATVSGS